MRTTRSSESIASVWSLAANELGIEVVAPFTFEVEGRAHDCLAWLPHFGGKHGIIVVGTEPPDYPTSRETIVDAEREGYKWSFVDIHAYEAFDRSTFIEMLREWGYRGPESAKPEWL